QDTSSCGGDATEDSAKYLDELVKDMRELNALPGTYPHALRLLNEEVNRVWCVMYPGGVSAAVPAASTVPLPLLQQLLPSLAAPPPSSSSTVPLLPSSSSHQHHSSLAASFSQHEDMLAIQRAYAALVGSHFDPFEGGVTVQEKIPIPYSPRCNFIGRILGPRGISVKQIESETGCHILVRGRGSVKDPVREARLLSHPGWEHLAEPLHVLIKATDVSQASAETKLRRGVVAVTKLLTPSNDEHKRRQLVQLAIINGT
ncbi:hypothetical protein PENTCL1PPCAC_10204, partial [Pristionchus entomophagus]